MYYHQCLLESSDGDRRYTTVTWVPADLAKQGAKLQASCDGDSHIWTVVTVYSLACSENAKQKHYDAWNRWKKVLEKPT